MAILLWFAALAQQEARTPEKWVAQLSAADDESRAEADRTLRALGVEGLPALRLEAERLARSNGPARERVAQILAAIEREVLPQVPALIHQLGAEEYVSREEASRVLALIGPPAMPALEEAAGSDDLEIQTRARHIIAVVRNGPFRNAMEAFCRANGLPVDGLEEIEPGLTLRFHPDVRFFAVRTDEAGHHCRVSRSGAVERIEPVGGGDITSMVGDGRPLLLTAEDVRAYLDLVISLRYGFEDLDRSQLSLDALGEGRWGMQASIRYFTITFDGDGRLTGIDMR